MGIVSGITASGQYIQQRKQAFPPFCYARHFSCTTTGLDVRQSPVLPASPMLGEAVADT